MHVFDHTPQRDYEDGLRAVGGLLDEQGLEDALVVELAEGFLATGRRPGRSADRLAGPGYEHAETVLRDEQVDAATRRARTLRGSGRRAGRYERSFRLIGRRVDAERGSLILLVDQGDGFLLRMLATGGQGSPYRSTTLGTADLDVMRADSIGARGRSGPV